MRTEKEKMLNGDLYNPLDPQLCAERRRARLLLKAFNDTRDDQAAQRSRIIRQLIPAAERRTGLESGRAIEIGDGSVVTRDIPDAVFAAGNPCPVLRAI